MDKGIEEAVNLIERYLKAFIFVEHIAEHHPDEWIVCRDCGKTIDQIYKEKHKEVKKKELS